MAAKITIPLDLPDVRVLDVELTKSGEYSITVESTKQYATCRKCGRRITKSHGHDKEITLRHLPILGRPVYIRLRPKRYKCPHCPDEPTTTQQLSWHEPNSPNTKPYEEHILRQLVNSTPQDVVYKEKVSYDTVLGIIDRYIDHQVDWDQFHGLYVLGLDEVALRKGRRDYVTIVSAQLSSGRVTMLAVLPDRTKATVTAFLQSIPERLQATIDTVCSDMYRSYIYAVRDVLDATIVADRYHVAKQYRDCADKLRRKERKRLKRELSEDEYEAIKGSMWPFRKNRADLEPDEAECLERLFSYSPDLELAYTLREDLTAIFEEDLTKEEAMHAINAWKRRVLKSDLSCFDSFLGTLDTYMDEITNYFLQRHTSGFVEGLNNKIKVLKRRCYGIFNLTHLFQRLFLDLEGYRLYA